MGRRYTPNMAQSKCYRETFTCPAHAHPLDKINAIGAKVRETAKRMRRPGMTVACRHVQCDTGRHVEVHTYEFYAEARD